MQARACRGVARSDGGVPTLSRRRSPRVSGLRGLAFDRAGAFCRVVAAGRAAGWILREQARHERVDLTIHTGGETSAGKLIDHIATSDQLKCSAIHPWPATNERGRLSDHAGVAADLTRLG